MKLTKYKVGLYTTVLLVALALIGTLGLGVSAEVYNIDKAEFKSLEGTNLSSSYSEDDTLNFTFDEVIQEKTIIVDLEDITINGGGAVIKVETDDEGPSLILKECGATIKDLDFRPSENVGSVLSAIMVDFSGACCCFQPQLVLKNLSIGWGCGGGDCQAGGSFIDGILFVNGNPNSTLDYSNIVFDEIETCCGVLRHGIHFYGNPDCEDEELIPPLPDDPETALVSSDGFGAIEDVYSLNFTNLKLKSCGQGDVMGAGIKFSNIGELRAVNIRESEREDYGIKGNDNGIWIKGNDDCAGVTRIEDFNIQDVDLSENNCHGFWVESGSEMDTIDNLNLVSSTIIENGGYGIYLGGELSQENVCCDTIFGPSLGANLNKVKFEELVVRDNTMGGALLMTAGVGNVGSTAPYGLKVVDSRFNNENPTQKENDQALGLGVFTNGGIRHVEVHNSTFHNHDTEKLVDKCAPEKEVCESESAPFSGFGFLLSSCSGDCFGPIEDVVLENSSSSYNESYGVSITGKSVADVSVKVTDSDYTSKFNKNGIYGILIRGLIGVDGITVADEDGDDSKDLHVDENKIWNCNYCEEGEVKTSTQGPGTGLGILSSDGNIGNVSVSSATFDENEGQGIILQTVNSGDIEEASFADVTANDNKGGSGLAINSADGFSNNSDTVLIDPSQFNNNKDHGVYLNAENSVDNPVIKDSEFKDNNGDGNDVGAGIWLKAGSNSGDELSGAVVENNVVTGNYHGVVLGKSWKIIDATVQNNVEISGNGPRNISIDGLNLQDISILDNKLINDVSDEEYGLYLNVGGTGGSANIEVARNHFESGIQAPCGGAGTAIQLNARDVSIHHNQFDRFDPTIVVTQESGSSPSNASETSNHINTNNFLGCCTTIDAGGLNGDKMVDATDNYWGEDAMEAS
ncbi:hypothetical protein KGY77_09720, partial [Candidatus Bipolaricaulota bacterium]|nr:hypothetical protein [Candidatus Bipolaricaulota bacterium]